MSGSKGLEFPGEGSEQASTQGLETNTNITRMLNTKIKDGVRRAQLLQLNDNEVSTASGVSEAMRTLEEAFLHMCARTLDNLS